MTSHHEGDENEPPSRAAATATAKGSACSLHQRHARPRRELMRVRVAFPYTPTSFLSVSVCSIHRPPGEDRERRRHEIPCGEAGEEELRWHLWRGLSSIHKPQILYCFGIYFRSFSFHLFHGRHGTRSRTHENMVCCLDVPGSRHSKKPRSFLFTDPFSPSCGRPR